MGTGYGGGDGLCGWRSWSGALPEVAVAEPLSDASVDALDLEQAVRLLVAENGGSGFSTTTVKRTLPTVRRETREARRLRGRDLEEADRPRLIRTLSELYQVGGPGKKPRFLVVDEVLPAIFLFVAVLLVAGFWRRVTADSF